MEILHNSTSILGGNIFVLLAPFALDVYPGYYLTSANLYLDIFQQMIWLH